MTCALEHWRGATKSWPRRPGHFWVTESPGRHPLPRFSGARYVVPLREGGSLPAVVDTDNDGSFVVKFRGAGQGPKALIAEALVALVGRRIGLPVPKPAIVELEDGFGRNEPDPEIQDILRGSVG